jgi:hypothetical protein
MNSVNSEYDSCAVSVIEQLRIGDSGGVLEVLGALQCPG